MTRGLIGEYHSICFIPFFFQLSMFWTIFMIIRWSTLHSKAIKLIPPTHNKLASANSSCWAQRIYQECCHIIIVIIISVILPDNHILYWVNHIYLNYLSETLHVWFPPAFCRSTRLRELALPSQRSFEVQLSSGSKARVQLLLPPSWREELRDAAFPVLVHV